MNGIYARQSVDRADSISIESQIEHCKYEVKKEEYKVYADKGFSGKNTSRPEFQTMMEHIKQGVIKKVIVYKLDRISRSILDFSKMMEIFKEYGVEFVSTVEKFDTSTPMGNAMLNICIVFAQLERETIQKRVTDAYASRSKMGLYMGGHIPYGFKRKPININGINTSQYASVEHEITHIKTIYGLYSNPVASLSDIVKYLRKNDIENSRGIEWSTSRISEMMRNPIYVKADVDIYNFYISRGTEVVNLPENFIGENGCYLYTKNVKAMGTRKNMSQYENMILVLAPHKGIIDSETWLKCRLKAEANTQMPNARKTYRTWLSGKLKCAKCGYALRYNKWKGKTAENEYYICSEVSGNRRCEGIGAVKKEFIEPEILKQVQEKLYEIKAEQSQLSAYHVEINTIKAAVASKEQEIEDMIHKFEGGGEAVMRRLNAKIVGLENDIVKLKNDLLTIQASETGIRQIDTNAIEKIFEVWANVSIDDKQAVADVLIQKVLISKQYIDIVWKA